LRSTSCSWLNAVEGFFAKLAKRRLKRGVFHSLVDLQAAINRFVAEHNTAPMPFTWTADPDKIIAAVRRGHHPLDRRWGLPAFGCHLCRLEKLVFRPPWTRKSPSPALPLRASGDLGLF
jgi:hypothetical protein